jgi:competence protein ComEC
MQLSKQFFFSLTIHPLLLITFALLLGICWQSFNFSFYIPFSLWLCMILSCYFYDYHQKQLLLFTTTFIIGCASLESQQAKHLLYQEILNQPLTIELTITHEQERDHPYLKYAYTGNIKSLVVYNTKIQYYFNSKKVMLYTPRKLNLQIADSIQIDHAQLKNPSNESIHAYFMKENIVGTLFIQENEFIKTNTPQYSFWRIINQRRNELLVCLKNNLHPNTFAFFSLLFLGNKSIQQKTLSRLKEQFKQWGISHYLARSGLHLVLFIVLWELLLKLIPFPFMLKHILLLFITITYFLLTWTSLSFFRSYCTFLIYKLGIIANRQTNSLHTLTLITAVLLFFNPMYLFFLDFQLSFGVTFLLSWISRLNTQKNYALIANS